MSWLLRVRCKYQLLLLLVPGRPERTTPGGMLENQRILFAGRFTKPNSRNQICKPSEGELLFRIWTDSCFIGRGHSCENRSKNSSIFHLVGARRINLYVQFVQEWTQISDFAHNAMYRVFSSRTTLFRDDTVLSVLFYFYYYR